MSSRDDDTIPMMYEYVELFSFNNITSPYPLLEKKGAPNIVRTSGLVGEGNRLGRSRPAMLSERSGRPLVFLKPPEWEEIQKLATAKKGG